MSTKEAQRSWIKVAVAQPYFQSLSQTLKIMETIYCKASSRILHKIQRASENKSQSIGKRSQKRGLGRIWDENGGKQQNKPETIL